MKKLLFLFMMVSAFSFGAFAQEAGGDQAARMAAMKERIKPELVEKTKITAEQADMVLDVQFALGQKRREIFMDNSISQEEKTKRVAEVDAARDKEYMGKGLTEGQVKAVSEFFVELRKRPRPNN